MTKYQNHLRTLFLLFTLTSGVGCLLFSMVLFIVSDARSNPSWPYIFLAIGVTFIYAFAKVQEKSKSKTRNAIEAFKCNEFSPTKEYELKTLDAGKYLGIDVRSGTILLVSTTESIYRGKTILELSGYECNGNSLTLKFNDVYFPYFRISAGTESKCMNFGRKLDALLSSSYRPEKDSGKIFNEFVKQKSLAY
ncbi:hypothetical protein ACSJM2_23530 [Serratia marcescens]|uniref:hypothetical protein n=1 Tax=Serratia TaxID=613 RepID=UPI002FE56B91